MPTHGSEVQREAAAAYEAEREAAKQARDEAAADRLAELLDDKNAAAAKKAARDGVQKVEHTPAAHQRNSKSRYPNP